GAAPCRRRGAVLFALALNSAILFLAIFGVVIAIAVAVVVALQFEAEKAASREDVDVVTVCEQASALRAGTPVDHVAGDLRSAFDAAGAPRRAVGKLELVMKLEQLLPGVGVERDHGSLAVLVADEHDTVADGERAERLAGADRALDSVERRPLPQ